MTKETNKKIRLAVITVVFIALALATMHKYNVISFGHHHDESQAHSLSCPGH